MPRHVSWKYESFLAEELARLDATVNEEENEQQQRLLKERLDRGKRQKMSLEKPTNQDKRAKHLTSWMGARAQTPNLVTQLSEVEQLSLHGISLISKLGRLAARRMSCIMRCLHSQIRQRSMRINVC